MLGSIGNVGVGIQGETCGEAVQHTGNSFNVQPILHVQSGEGAPESVEPHLYSLPHRVFPRLGHIQSLSFSDGLFCTFGAGRLPHFSQWVGTRFYWARTER